MRSSVCLRSRGCISSNVMAIAPRQALPASREKLPMATVQDTHGLTSCSIWTGVPLSLLLGQAGVQKGASWIVAEGTEEGKHTKSIPLEKAMDDCLVVYGQNGEALRPEQGYPLRLLVPGWQGINNVKWLRRIYVVDEPYMAMMESTKYPSPRLDGKSRWFESEMGPKSVITRPSGGQQLSARGFYEITGLGVVGRRRDSPRRSLRRRRPDVERRAASAADRAEGAYAVRPGLDLEWRGSGAPVPLHRRPGARAADRSRTR